LARSTKVVRLQPLPLAPASLSDARAMWANAEIRACLDALYGDSSAEGATLAARCCLRLNTPNDALERLTAAYDATLGASDGVRGEYSLVLSLTHFLLGNDELTDSSLSETRAYIYSTRDLPLETELNVIESQVAWSRHDLRQAQTMAQCALQIAPAGKWRARSFETLGIVAGARGKYKEQISLYERAWDALDEAAENEPWLRGVILQVLAGLCNGLYRRDLAKRLIEREQALSWTADIEYMHFTVLRHLARCHALAGDHLASFRLLRKAAEVAPSLPWRILIFAERASLAGEMNERLFASEELDQAQSFAAACNWSQVRGDERLGLLRLAEITAAENPSQARLLLDLYRKKLPPLAPHTLWANDDRWTAVEAHSFGMIALHLGETSKAVERLTRAFEIWRGIDYVWRAADAAIHLSRLTGADVFTAYARRHAPAFPGTWLARQVAQL